jgi:hypothetical protein
MDSVRLDLHGLAGLLLSQTGKGPVVTLYLAPEPGRSLTTEVLVTDLVKEAEAAIVSEKDLDPAAQALARAALDRAAAALAKGVKESTQGTWVAIAGDGQVRTLHLPCTLRSRAVVGWRPYVGPLAALLERADRYAVVLVDHRETKIFAHSLGELEQLEWFLDPALQNVRGAGWFGRDTLKANHHRDAVLHRHLRHTADALFAHHKRSPFDRIILVGHPPATLSNLESCLHPYLASRVVAREHWDLRSTAGELCARIAGIVERVEGEKERDLIDRVRDPREGHLHTAIGADASLAALWAGRVATLLVPEGAGLGGRACEVCGFLATDGAGAKRACRECGGPTRHVDDLIEEASELAVSTGASVRSIGHAKAELESLGGVGALLRHS